MGDLAEAQEDLAAAIEILTPLQASFDLARCHLFLAALLNGASAGGQAVGAAAWREAAVLIVRGGYGFLLEQERALAFPLLAQFMTSADPEVADASSALLGQLARVPPPPLHVRGLGRFQVCRKRRPIPNRAWRQRRAGELFRLLLVSPRHSLLREQVIEALWPGDPPAARQTQFHQATSALRQALEPDLPDKFPSRYVQVEGGRVTLRLPAGTWLDWVAFEEQVRDGAWEAAMGLYEGILFPDDLYADWAAVPREHLSNLYIQALHELGRARLEDGRPREALDACRLILGIEPWQESAVLLGMQACLDLEDRASAVRLYRNLARTLQEELDILPQEPLQDLYQSLLDK
jgi:DNA-binding SARP family transcriptional activator